MTAQLTLAAPKGRVLDEAIALFARAGIQLGPLRGRGRALVCELPEAGLRVLCIRDQDVPTFVEYGAADVGIVGSDVLEERGHDLYEPLDLGIGRCRLMVAEPIDRPVDETSALHLRYATKFPNLARRHLSACGVTAEIIKLSGSIEIGPLLGLSDRIIDLVQTGETLRQNRLREVETILEVSSRLVVNRAALRLKRKPVARLIARLERAIEKAAQPRAKRAARGRS
jgi:ATP phosphoribosyltransferase